MTTNNQQFGLLSYSTYNLGDYIQSIAVRKFLPRIDRYIDREALDSVVCEQDTCLKTVLNGWYCDRPDRWPPSPFIYPLLTSFHVSDTPGLGSGLRAREQLAKRPDVLRYLRMHGPVGARDNSTKELLNSWGVESYFSGCLTLTLDRPAVAKEAGLIIMNDVPDAVIQTVARATKQPIRMTGHRDAITEDIQRRFANAEALLECYASASCVLTTRLHCALPCLAMGVPVLFFDIAPDTYRFSGLSDLVHHCSVEEFTSGRVDYDVRNPPPNPVKHLSIRTDLERRVADFIRS